VLAGAEEAQSLQASVMAVADTSMQRIAAELGLGQPASSPEARRDETNVRLILASALIAIAVEPDPVDALADMLTNTTLTADAQRNAAKDKPADSFDVKLLKALEQNEADAWRLAERWVDEPTRKAFRAQILAWPGPRTSAAAVAFVRLPASGVPGRRPSTPARACSMHCMARPRRSIRHGSSRSGRCSSRSASRS
jgi:hypothetical protein